MPHFYFPRPGDVHNASSIPMSDEDMYWLLVASAPLLVAGGEPADANEGLNKSLLAWWNAMNALDRKLAIRCQSTIREQLGKLPEAPWEECDSVGNVIGPEPDTEYLNEMWERMNGEQA